MVVKTASKGFGTSSLLIISVVLTEITLLTFTFLMNIWMFSLTVHGKTFSRLSLKFSLRKSKRNGLKRILTFALVQTHSSHSATILNVLKKAVLNILLQPGGSIRDDHVIDDLQQVQYGYGIYRNQIIPPLSRGTPLHRITIFICDRNRLRPRCGKFI